MTITVEPRILRDYQGEAVDAVQAAWEDGAKRVGVAMATGLGKSTVLGKLISDAFRQDKTVLILAHRQELLHQIKRDTLAVDPSIDPDDIGIVCAEQDDHHCPIVLATLQTTASARRRNALGKRDVIFWDEVHHAGAPGYNTTFRELGGYDQALMCGVTATMRREKPDPRSRNSANWRGEVGLGAVIEKVVYQYGLKRGIQSGYLSPLRGMVVRSRELDALSTVRTVAGDFHQADLAEVMEDANGVVVSAVLQHAADRRPIIFAASVRAAHDIAEALTEADYPAVAVTGEMGYGDRSPLYDAYKNGEVRALVTVMVLTEGADFPMCDCITLARPTKSQNLYSQMIGRGVRIHPGKDDALILDLMGTTRRLKLVTLVDLDTGAEIVEVDEHGTVIEPEVEDEDVVEEETQRVARRGPVEMEDIDLLASDVTWITTRRGIPFVSLIGGTEVVFCFPEGAAMPANRRAARWCVGQIDTKSGAGNWITASGNYRTAKPEPTDIGQALEAAETWIEQTGQYLPRRNASWRLGDAPPTDKQLALARRMRIANPAGMTKARLSDEISAIFAGDALDRKLKG